VWRFIISEQKIFFLIVIILFILPSDLKNRTAVSPLKLEERAKCLHQALDETVEKTFKSETFNFYLYLSLLKLQVV